MNKIGLQFAWMCHYFAIPLLAFSFLGLYIIWCSLNDTSWIRAMHVSIILVILMTGMIYPILKEASK